MAFLAPLIGIGLGAAGAALSAGSKVRVPEFREVNANAEQRKALQGNLASFDEAARLAEATNSFNQEELRRLNRTNIPRFDEIQGLSADVVASLLRGELPSDVRAQISRTSAARALAGGYAGSGLARNLEARDIGRTSLDLTLRGLDASRQYLATQATIARPQPFDVSTMFLEPAAAISTAQSNSQGAFSSGVLAARANAAPDPTSAFLGGLLSDVGGFALGGGFSGLGSGRSDNRPGGSLSGGQYLRPFSIGR